MPLCGNGSAEGSEHDRPVTPPMRVTDRAYRVQSSSQLRISTSRPAAPFKVGEPVVGEV